MRIVTHSGAYHADDIFAVATLLLIYPDAEVVRSRDPEVIATGDIVVDVGQVYDAEKMLFDHHQTGGAGIRPNGIPYASFGLVWEKFGPALGSKEEREFIEEKLVYAIDAMDNGVLVNNPVFQGVWQYTISDFFYSFLDHAEHTDQDLHGIFMDNVHIARGILLRELHKAREKLQGMKEVREIFERSADKRIIVLDKEMSWKRVLIPIPEVLFVVGPRKEGTWGVNAVPKDFVTFERKKYFPIAWAGLENDLAQVTGVEGAIFCHKDRFLVTAKSKEGAERLAEMALNTPTQ